MIMIRVFLFTSTRREIHILVTYQKSMNKHPSKWHPALFQQTTSFTCTGVAKPTQADRTSDLPFIYCQPVGRKPLGNFSTLSFHLIIPSFKIISIRMSVPACLADLLHLCYYFLSWIFSLSNTWLENFWKWLFSPSDKNIQACPVITIMKGGGGMLMQWLQILCLKMAHPQNTEISFITIVIT